MYHRSAEPYGPASCRSMKTAQPASLPPGVCGSGGIRRSTSASTAAPSSGVKYTQGPGGTGVGGLPAFGDQGKLPCTTNADAVVVENMSVIAVLNSSSRRLTPGVDRDAALNWISSATMVPLEATQEDSRTPVYLRIACSKRSCIGDARRPSSKSVETGI